MTDLRRRFMDDMTLHGMAPTSARPPAGPRGRGQQGRRMVGRSKRLPGSGQGTVVDLSGNVYRDATQGIAAVTGSQLSSEQEVACLLRTDGPRGRKGAAIPRAVRPPDGLRQ